MYGCESWTIKKAECQRIDAFELWWWIGLLRVAWTARRSNQSILKEISPEYSLEGLMLKLKLQYFGHMMWRVDSLEKTLMLGKTEGGRKADYIGWDVGWHQRLNGHEFEQAPGVGDGQGRLACCSPWGHKVSDMTEWLNWPRAHPLAVSCGVTKCLSLPGLRRPQTEGLGHRTFSAKMKTHRQIRTHGSSQLSGPLSCFSALTTSENMSCWLPGLYPIDWLMSIHENVLWKQSPSCIIHWLQGFEQRIQYLWVSNFSSLKWDWDILCVRYDILHVTYLMR